MPAPALLVSVFLAGAVVGAATTSLWRAGEGLAEVAEQLQQPDPAPLASAQPGLSMADFDFFEVLEELPPEAGAPRTAPKAQSPAAQAPRPQPAAQSPPPQTAQAPAADAADPPLPAPSPSGAYLLRTGSFANPNAARNHYRRLINEGYMPTVRRAQISGQPIWQVHLGPYASYADMDNIDTRLKQLGIRSLRLKQSPPRNG